jgi:hypothetical protein
MARQSGTNYSDSCHILKISQQIEHFSPAGFTIGTTITPFNLRTCSCKYFNLLFQPLIANKFYSYKGEAPTLQQHVPKLIQLSPIEAAGKIYKVNQISGLQSCSFQVTKLLHYVKQNTPNIYYKI